MNSVYTIIVCYNGTKWIRKCLTSVSSSSIDVKIIVVDNNSKDRTIQIIEEEFPSVMLLKQTKNLGFGQANNIGIRYALDHGAEQVFLLNQDAYLVEDALAQIIRFQKTHPDFGILSPLHITANKQKLDFNFSKYMLRDKTGQFYSDFVLGNDIKEVYDVPFVNAAAWLLSRQCLETVGGFDPLFFHYGEDDNYCQRVIYHGFKIGVLPKAYVVHDREDRVHEQVAIFSATYFKNIEKQYKINYANINVINTIDLKVSKLKKTILKLLLKMKFKRAIAYKKELSLLLNSKPMIERSRKINKNKGSHYI